MTDKVTEEAIETMVERLVDRFDPDQIILFGSQARGTAGPGRDVDLLVIMPVTGSKRARQLEMRMALHDIAVPKRHHPGNAGRSGPTPRHRRHDHPTGVARG